MLSRVKHKIPLILLLLLSPVIAELLSGSSPPLEFFNPLVFVLLVGLYGSGVLIVRELSLEWGNRWSTILLLGIAYGIIEEGLAVKSFFDPQWMDLGILGVYGRWIGVNWVWSFYLALFHAIYSIALPILIFNLIFPSLKNKRLLSCKGIGVVFAILFVIVGFCCLMLTPYRPDVVLYLATLLIVVVLFVAAWKNKVIHIAIKNVEPLIRPLWFGVVGAIFTVSFFLTMYAVPHLVSFPPVPILIGTVLCLLVVLFVIKYSGKTNNSHHMFSLTSGLLSFLIFLAFIHEINGIPGMSVVGIFFIVFLLYIRRRIIRQTPAFPDVSS